MLKWLDLLLRLLLLLLLLRVSVDAFQAYQPSRDRVVAGCSPTTVAARPSWQDRLVLRKGPGPMPAAPP